MIGPIRGSLAAMAFAFLVPAALAAQQPVTPVTPVPPLSGGESPQLQPYQVGEALPPVAPGASLVPLSLDQAIARALDRNLDIQSARINPQLQELSTDVAYAAFRPTFGLSFGHNNSSSQSTSQLDGGARTSTQRNTFNTSVSQTLPWYGGRLSTSFNNSRTSTDNAFSTRNPSYSSSISFNYSQPLLSGLRMDNQRNTLRTQEIQADIVAIQLENQISNITDQVRVAYWNLRSAIEQIEIQRRSLAQAEQLLANNRIRVQLGTLADIEIFQAESQVANAQQSLLNAEIQWRNQELSFKRLIVGGAADPFLAQTINPIDMPAYEEIAVDIDGAIANALRNRTDVKQQREQRRIAELNLEVTRENARPDLSLSASYSLQGVGGNLFDRSGLGGTAQLIERGGYIDGLRSIAEFDTPTWNVGLNFSYPLGMSAGKANLERARLQLRQSDLALAAQELAVTTEVTNAGLAVRNTYLQLEAARRSREAAERTAEAELLKFGVGVSTNFQVGSVQNSLTSARLAELRAIISYNNAIAEFDRVQRVGR